MKISVNWLSKYMDVAPLRADLSGVLARLTMRGLEVEAVHDLSKGFEKVITAQIEARDKHPNADRLSVCRVNTGKETLQIVCGAQNMKAGDKVALAQIGAHLPINLKIEKSKIRDVESFGMLCSETELAIADKSEGILILPANAPVGLPLAQYLERNDVVFTLNVTPNRGDALSHWGVARELAALLGQTLKQPTIQLKEDKTTTASKYKVSVESSGGTERCFQYHARAINGVKVGASPQWLKTALEAVGQRSINNVVDITNFILLELGQPLHAFDSDKLRGGAIFARSAKSGEKIPLLDGTEIQLTAEDAVIADAERPVALAGVMGGGNSEVTETTKNILLEGAQFLPASVRKTARRFQKQTDSSYRFERQVDARQVTYALDRAAQLIQEVAGGVVLAGRVSAYSKQGENLVKGPLRSIQLSIDEMNSFLGTELSRERTVEMLESIGFTGKGAGSGMLDIEVPSYRPDVQIVEDLYEEVVRVLGYNSIVASVPVLSDLPATTSGAEKRFAAVENVKKSLARAGFNEALHFAFVSEELNKKWGEGPGVRLANPLNEEFTTLKSSLLTGLVPSFVQAIYRQEPNVRMFEVRPVFYPDPASETGVTEQWRVALIASGRSYSNALEKQDRDFDFYCMKGVVEELLDEMGVRGLRYQNFEKADPRFHPTQSVRIVMGKGPSGMIARLHPK